MSLYETDAARRRRHIGHVCDLAMSTAFGTMAVYARGVLDDNLWVVVLLLFVAGFLARVASRP